MQGGENYLETLTLAFPAKDVGQISLGAITATRREIGHGLSTMQKDERE